MQKFIATGRLIKDVDVRQAGNTTVGKYTIAVERMYKKEGQPTADFIPCTAFGKSADFAEKYFRKGMKVEIVGEIRTGSYTNKEGNKVYTTEVLVESQGFAESKGSQNNEEPRKSTQYNGGDSFIDIPDGIDEELPFN